jgi:hypothetical protein
MLQGIPDHSPGKLCSELAMACLKVDALQGQKAFLSELRTLESCIAPMPGITLQVSGGGK